MFAATTHQVVKSLGKDTLTPVRSVDRADNVAPFSIVLKERRRRLIFWKRTQCLSTEFTLEDIFAAPWAADEKAKLLKKRILATFNYETDFSLSGKLGVDLSKELLDVDIDASDSVNVKSSLGELSKEEVDLQSFLDFAKNRHIDLTHPLVAPLLNDSSKTLCLVTGVVRLTKAASITGSANVKGSEELKAAAGKVDTSGDVSETKTKTLLVPANTALAYSVYDLQVSKQNGLFSLVLDSSRRGGFVTSLSLDQDDGDGPSDAMGATTLFQGIQNMSGDDKEALRLCTLTIVQAPKCLDALNDLLHKAADFLEVNIEKTTTVQSLRNKIPSLDDRLLHFLAFAGFQQLEDDTLLYPQCSTEVFESCELLVSLLDELDDAELGVAASFLQDAAASRSLITSLHPVWEKDVCEVALEGDQQWLGTDVGRKLTSVFGLTVEEQQLLVPQESLLDLQALYLVVDAFMASE